MRIFNLNESKPQLEQFQNQLKDMGRNAGITFNQETTVAAETFTAHKLLHFAKEYDKADAMEEAQFIAHFVNGKNIEDADFLISITGQIGLDGEKFKRALIEEHYNYEVKQDIMEEQNLGFSGVPYYLLNNKYAISSTQPVEFFTKALLQTYQESIVHLSPESGDNMCGIDGCSI